MDDLKRLYVRLLPELTRSQIRVYAKSAVGLATAALTAINLWVPDYSDEATAIVGTIIVIAGWLGVRRVPNA